MNILCIGHAVCDVLAQPVDVTAFERDSTRLESLTVLPGGDALNCAIQCAKLGNDVSLIGAMGRDMFAGEVLRVLAERGVDTSRMVVRKDMPTSVSLVMIDKHGDRRFIYHGKTNDSFCLNDVPEDTLIGRDGVHFGSAVGLRGWPGADIARLFIRAKAHGALTFLDVTWSQREDWRQAVEPALNATDYFLPSMLEASHLAGSESLADIRAYFARFNLRALIVKLGAEGCYVTDFVDEWRLPIYDISPVIDTTGAGDTFAAGFISAILRGQSLKDSAYFANVVAGHSVTAIGATSAEFTWDMIEKCIKIK